MTKRKFARRSLAILAAALCGCYPTAYAWRLASAQSCKAARQRPRTLRMARKDEIPESTDVVVIGSGVGGLSCASVLATYGLDVAVCESHYRAGGAAHGFEIDGFHFDAGPSLFSGLSVDASPNPLKHVLDFIGEKVDWMTYDTWGVVLPEGSFDATIGPEPFQEVLARFGGPKAKEEWAKLMHKMEPLSVGAMALPPAVLRGDLAVVLSMLRFAPATVKTITTGPELQRPLSQLIEEVGISDPFIKNWLSLLCFLLQGLGPQGTMTAVMAYMLADWYRPGVVLDYPRGGTKSLVNALCRGVTKNGGKVLLSTHVDEVMVERGRAVGVRLKGGEVIRARKAVVSGASIWDTAKLIPSDSPDQGKLDEMSSVKQCASFLHLHLGLDAEGLNGLQCHYAVVDDWGKGIEAPGNVVIISIPSVLDPTLAPPGCHTLHAYTAGNEPYDLYEGLRRGTREYEEVKERRAQMLWRAVEKVIPDVRSRLKVKLVGTPLTHERFLRRSRGTYGPAIRAGTDNYPPAKTPIKGLTLCGDSVFPGIGMPAVAASGTIAANNLVPIWKHFRLLNSIRM